MCLWGIFFAFPVSRAEDSSSVPEIGKEIPGVDTEKMQQDLDKVLGDVQKKLSEATPVLPPKEQKDEGKKEAQQAMDGFNATKSQKRLQDEKARVQQENMPKTGIPLAQPESKKGGQLQQGSSNPLTGTPETVYVFLSSSVPDDAVHAYLTQAALYGNGRIAPVFYGLTDGLANKKAAGRYFGHVLQEDLGCTDLPDKRCLRMKVRIAVGSALYKQYGVTQVPTVVYTNGEDSWALGGDSSLDFMLTRINSEARTPFLEEVIKRLRGTH